jgi:hypothetical protein
VSFREVLPFAVLVLGIIVEGVATFAPATPRADQFMKLGDLLVGGGLMGIAPGGIRTILGGERATDVRPGGPTQHEDITTRAHQQAREDRVR